jgi:hypothetical protein
LLMLDAQRRLEGVPRPPGSSFPARKHVELWRAHNRRRWELEKDVLAAYERAPFVCECTSDRCLRGVELTMSEYEAAHLRPSWCAVLPEHVMDDDGARVERKHPRYWVVELSPLIEIGEGALP